MGIEEALESPGFYILAAGGVGAEIMGYMWAKSADMVTLPLWQLGAMIVVTVLAAAFFGTRD